MSESSANSLTGYSISSALAAYEKTSASLSNLVKQTNSTFSMIHINTEPFDALQKSMGKLQVATNAMDFAKMSINLAKFTTGIIANTMACNLGTAAKKSQTMADLQEIKLYATAIGSQTKSIANKMKETIQNNALTKSIKSHTTALNKNIVSHAKSIASSIKGTAIKAKDVIQTGLSTTATKIHTAATKIHTMALNSNIAAHIKLMAQYVKAVAMKAKDIIQTGLETAATNISTAAHAAFNAVMNMNPISIVIIAIVALIAIMVLLFNKCKPFHDWVINAINTISATVISVFGPIGPFMENLCGNIGGFFKGMVDGAIDGLNAMISALNSLHFDIPGWVPVLGGKSFGISIPLIPRLARGGIIDNPTYAMLGESGREAVVPLENTGFVAAIAAAVGKSVGSAVHSGSVNGGNCDINLTLQVDRDILGKATINAINSQIRRTGVIPLAI